MHRKKGHVVNCPLQPPFIFNRIQAPCISFAMYLATCIKYSAALPAPMPPATSETSSKEAGAQITDMEQYKLGIWKKIWNKIRL